jgi:hypothetical protein
MISPHNAHLLQTAANRSVGRASNVASYVRSQSSRSAIYSGNDNENDLNSNTIMNRGRSYHAATRGVNRRSDDHRNQNQHLNQQKPVHLLVISTNGNFNAHANGPSQTGQTQISQAQISQSQIRQSQNRQFAQSQSRPFSSFGNFGRTFEAAAKRERNVLRTRLPDQEQIDTLEEGRGVFGRPGKRKRRNYPKLS